LILRSDMIKTSIIVRCKNERRKLKDLLDSLCEQTKKKFELIIIDNNSQDGTLDLIKSYPVAALVQIPDSEFGHALSCNLGAYIAKTNYLVFTNGHCLPISKTWLADGLSALVAKDKIAAVDGHYCSGKDGSVWEKLERILGSRILKKDGVNFPITTTNAIIRKDLWKKYQFDESLPECEDYDWAREMISRGFQTIRNHQFNVYHSHNLGLVKIVKRQKKWTKICNLINQKKRPSTSLSRVFDKNFWKNTQIKISRFEV